MLAAVPPRSIVDDDPAVGDRSCRARLPYGEVRVGPGELVIGVESLPHVSPIQRCLYEQAVAAAGVDPDDVLVVRVTETGIEVDALDPDDERWPVRTRRVAPDRRSIDGTTAHERLTMSRSRSGPVMGVERSTRR
jgi:hypothetical protein